MRTKVNHRLRITRKFRKFRAFLFVVVALLSQRIITE